MLIHLLKSFALTGGEWVIYILILCSILSLAVVIERAVVLSRERKEIREVRTIFERSLENGSLALPEELRKFSGVSARVLTAGFSGSSGGIEAAEETMASAVSDEKRRIEVRMVILNTLGNNAVYIGLFGTVLGVIKAFHDLAQESGAGPEVVMQGLSEALIATAVGLLVAIPCVIAYNILQKQIKDILSQTDSMTHALLAQIKSEKSNRS